MVPLQKIKAAGMRAGVVINPGTPVEALIPVLDLVDQVLIMTVNPGFGGQAFIPEMMSESRARCGASRKRWLFIRY